MHKALMVTLAALVVSPMIVLADAGHGVDIGKPGDPKKVSRTIEILGSDEMRYRPSQITVKRGETVRFVIKNSGKTDHEFVLGTMSELKEHAELMRKHPGMEHDEPNQAFVRPGETREIVWRFTKAGKVDFACTIPGHLEAGMVGKITVTAK